MTFCSKITRPNTLTMALMSLSSTCYKQLRRAVHTEVLSGMRPPVLLRLNAGALWQTVALSQAEVMGVWPYASTSGHGMSLGACKIVH